MGKRDEATGTEEQPAAQDPSDHADPADEARAALDSLTGAAEPLAVLDGARRLRETAESIESDAVRSARAAGVSWSKIGSVYGLTKQGAQQRFSPKNAGRRAGGGSTETTPEA
ncbi:MAG: hypothetical protein ACTHXO_01435 [Actinomycetaceae bacterium]